MATIGVSKPKYAIYTASGTTVSYASGGTLAKAVEFSASLNAQENNDLYADNGIADSDRTFSGGTLTITTDDITQTAAAAILGLTETTITDITGLTDTTAKEIVFDESIATPYLGFGIIIKKRMAGAIKYRAIVFKKIMFNVPDDAATTQGETIEWQTPELTATIMRDDSTSHAWKSEATFTNEADAEAYINARLNISST